MARRAAHSAGARLVHMLVMALLFVCDASLAAEPLPQVRLGTAPAVVELPNGDAGTIPGPYREIGGQLFVSRQRRSWFLAKQQLEKSASRHQSTQHVLPAEVRVNDTTGEFSGNGNTQNEPVMAVSGDTLLCAFTDSEGLNMSGSISLVSLKSFRSPGRL